jgi:hypothetical protein
MGQHVIGSSPVSAAEPPDQIDRRRETTSSPLIRISSVSSTSRGRVRRIIAGVTRASSGRSSSIGISRRRSGPERCRDTDRRGLGPGVAVLDLPAGAITSRRG